MRTFITLRELIFQVYDLIVLSIGAGLFAISVIGSSLSLQSHLIALKTSLITGVRYVDTQNDSGAVIELPISNNGVRAGEGR